MIPAAAPIAAMALVMLVIRRGREERLRATGSRDADLRLAREVLGVRPCANREEIVAAHRALIARVHPDRGGDEMQAQRANAARDLLLAGR